MLSAQIAKFVVVGLINTIVGYCLYALFIYFGLGYVYALGFATILGVLFNFQTIGRLVFGSNNGALLIKFVGVYIIVFAVNLLLINGMIRLGLNAYSAGAVALIPSAALSFLLNKYFVFNR